MKDNEGAIFIDSERNLYYVIITIPICSNACVNCVQRAFHGGSCLLAAIQPIEQVISKLGAWLRKSKNLTLNFQGGP